MVFIFVLTLLFYCSLSFHFSLKLCVYVCSEERKCDNPAEQENSEAVRGTFHVKFVIGEVVVGNIQHLVCVEVRKKVHCADEGQNNEGAFKMEQTDKTSKNKATELTEPIDNVQSFALIIT